MTANEAQPGYLIGGVRSMTGRSAELGDRDRFIVGADEYDSAFFDKHPKFVHYWCDVAVLNNFEFDHANIYRDDQEIDLQFPRLPRQAQPER